jgi:hypothetical protein
MTNFYAHGGHVGAHADKRDALQHKNERQHAPIKHIDSPAHLRYAAEEIRKAGRGRDKILAHINPEEARELSVMHGGDINRKTGLPQFGKKWNFFRRTLMPALASIGGFLLGGPLGAAAAGSVAGAIGDMNHPLQGIGRGLTSAGLTSLGGGIFGFGPGAASGAAGGTGGGLSNLFSGMGGGAGGGGGLSNLFSGMGGGGGGGGLLPSVMGMGSMFGGGRGQQQPDHPQQQQQPQQGASQNQGGFLNNLMQNPLQSALLATSILGTLHEGNNARKYNKSLQQQHDDMRAQFNGQSGNAYAPHKRSRKKDRRKLMPGDEGYDPENRYYEDINPEPEYYARGGYVNGASGGQDDDVKAKLKPNDYIMDATTVSLVGDGNSKAGAARIKREIEDKFVKGGITRNYPVSHNKRAIIDARLSPGEYRVPNHVVASIGKGNPREGAKVLDKMRHNLRRHKGVKTFLPPKSKPLTSYMR